MLKGIPKGVRAFGQCKACHSVVAGESKRTGPNLFGVLGHKAGSTDFNYSDIIITVGEAGLIWSSGNLDAFLSYPRNILAGCMYVGASQARTKKPSRWDKVPDVRSCLQIWVY